MWCRAELYPYGAGTFELMLRHPNYWPNQCVPVRYVGPIGLMNNIADTFLVARKAEGFQEQLPSYEPAPIN